MAESTAFARRGFKGGAKQSTIAAGIAAGATSFAGADLSTWAGAVTNGPSMLRFDPGLATEELAEFTTLSGNSVSGLTRGLRGTSAVAHDPNCKVELVGSDRDFDEANQAVNNTIGKITSLGDLLVGVSAGVMKRLGIGAAYKAVGVNAAGTDLTYLDTLASLLTVTGDIPYASGANTPARLPKGTGWQALAMNNGGTLPAYAAGFPGFVFADATARDAAITTPIKGMAAWLTGTGTIARTVYDGTAWRVWEVWGTGSPESSITATVGAMYHRTDGGASTSLYVKESGTGSTGWIAYGASGGGGFGTLSATQAHHSTTQSLTTATETAIIFDTEDFDTDGIHSTVSNTDRFTIVNTGTYEINAQVTFATNATGSRDASIKNGSTYLDYVTLTPGSAAPAVLTIPTFQASLTAGDIIRLYATQASGGNLNVSGDGNSPKATFVRIRRLA